MDNLVSIFSAPHLRIRAVDTVAHNSGQDACIPAISTLANEDSKGLSNKAHLPQLLPKPCREEISLVLFRTISSATHVGSHISHDTSACTFAAFRDEPRPIPEVVNFAQTSEKPRD
jgi:hypothetical protein